MELLELCEPLFQYVCSLRRFGRMHKMVDTAQISKKVKVLFEQMTTESNRSAKLSANYLKVELPLIFFVDFMIKASQLNLTTEWVEIARGKGELAGDEKFFDLLDEELANPHDDAAERLSIYYTCLGLGFTGIYSGQADAIQKLMLRISLRISDYMDTDQEAFVCPEAYQNVDTRNLIEPPGTKLVGIGILLVGLIFIWLGVYLALFVGGSKTVRNSVNLILGNDISQLTNSSDSYREY